MTELVDGSLQFTEIGSEATGCEDITFDLESPRDVVLLDEQVHEQQQEPHESQAMDVEPKDRKQSIPSILITQPSNGCLLDDSIVINEENNTLDNEKKNTFDNDEKNALDDEETDQNIAASADSKPDIEDDRNDISLDEKDHDKVESTSNDVDEKGDKVDISDDTFTGEVKDVKDDTISSTNEANPELIQSMPDPVSQNNEDDNAECNEADEMISLDNIIVQDKAGSDSDSEFDFDLPSNTQPSDVSLGTKESDVPSPGNKLNSKDDERVGDKPSQVISPEEVSSPCTTTTSLKPVAVIKPTTVSATLEHVQQEETVTDTRDDKVLEAAQAEWDNVTTIQAGFRDTSTGGSGVEPTIISTVKPMSTDELIQTFKEEDFSSVKDGITSRIERHGLAAFVNFLFGPPKLHRDLIQDRDRIFCVAATQLDNSNETHMRTLQTVYRCLTGSKFDCPRIGGHWEEIGFQGTDPGTDLRGAGMLGLLNLLHLLKDPKKVQLANDIYRLSLHPTQNFPFCIMGINLSRITLQSLREGLLNKECNRRHDVFGVVNDFYTALYLQLYQTWKHQHKTIADSGFVIKDIETRSKKNPRDVLKLLEDHLNKKTTVPVSTSGKTEKIGDESFVNICDDK